MRFYFYFWLNLHGPVLRLIEARAMFCFLDIDFLNRTQMLSTHGWNFTTNLPTHCSAHVSSCKWCWIHNVHEHGGRTLFSLTAIVCDLVEFYVLVTHNKPKNSTMRMPIYCAFVHSHLNSLSHCVTSLSMLLPMAYAKHLMLNNMHVIML